MNRLRRKGGLNPDFQWTVPRFMPERKVTN